MCSKAIGGDGIGREGERAELEGLGLFGHGCNLGIEAETEGELAVEREVHLDVGELYVHIFSGKERRKVIGIDVKSEFTCVKCREGIF